MRASKDVKSRSVRHFEEDFRKKKRGFLFSSFGFLFLNLSELNHSEKFCLKLESIEGKTLSQIDLVSQMEGDESERKKELHETLVTNREEKKDKFNISLMIS